MTGELRKYVRFRAKDNSFAAIRNGFHKVGKIDDISVDGLSFSFLSKIDQDRPVAEFAQIDIFNTKDEFHLSNVPCRIVYEIPEERPYKGSQVRMSRIGLQYRDLTSRQVEHVALFIEKFTTGILDSRLGK